MRTHMPYLLKPPYTFVQSWYKHGTDCRAGDRSTDAAIPSGVLSGISGEVWDEGRGGGSGEGGSGQGGLDTAIAGALAVAALASAHWPGLQPRCSGASTSAPVGQAVSGKAGSEAEGEAGCQHGSGEGAIAAALAAAAAAAAWSSQPCHCADRQLGRSTYLNFLCLVFVVPSRGRPGCSSESEASS